jgi:hypothetical protein
MGMDTTSIRDAYYENTLAVGTLEGSRLLVVLGVGSPHTTTP